MSLYRDPLAGLKSQVATKRGLVELRERELPPLIRAMLPAELRAVLEEEKAATSVDDTQMGLDELTALDAALDSVIAAYDEAIALGPKLRSCPLDVDDPPKPALPPPWLIEEPRQRTFRICLERRVQEISTDAYVVRWGDLAYLARMKVAGAPIVVTSSGNFDIATPTTTFKSKVRTSVHPSTPRLEVKLQTALGGVAKALGIARDDETGDARFDEAFLVDGANGGVLLLTPDVTAALTALEAWNATLVVRKGIAEVTWEAPFRGIGFELLHDAAFAVVLGIRAAIERA